MKVGIIGGGTMGLTLAWRLAQAGHEATVLEAAPQPGGLATWFDYGDFVWDKFYHVICPSDAHLLGLVDELGLSPRVRWTRTRTGFLWDGRLLSMSSHREFLTFPALSLFEKVRLAAGILRCRRIKDPAPLEVTPAPVWLTKIFGERVYHTVWEPLLESKYGVLKDQMPATIMWATINRYAATREKGGGQECLGFLSGGLKTLLDALTRAIEEHGGKVLCSTPVLGVEDANPDGVPQGVSLTTGRGPMHFDRVISTLPLAVLKKIAPAMSGVFDQLGPRPRFLGVIGMALVLRRPLSPFYITNLIQRGFSFTGIIEVSNLTGPEELAGRRLVMLPRYDVPGSPWFEKTAEEIAWTFMEELQPIWPNIRENLDRWFVHRERLVQAIWTDGPPTLVRPPRNAPGTVWVVNAELAGRDTLNNNAIIRVAGQAAGEILGGGADFPVRASRELESLRHDGENHEQAAGQPFAGSR